MGSRAQDFADGGTLKEYIDDDGQHYYVIQFEDDSGLVFQKEPSTDSKSVAEFVGRDESAMESMRMMSSATNFEVDERKNTQQNLREFLR